MRSFWLFVALSLCTVFSGCDSGPPVIPVNTANLRPPVFDAAFRKHWDDGLSEVSTYALERLRGGVLRKGSATSIVRRAIYSGDERVPVEGAKRQQGDEFPAIQMNWLERYTAGLQACEEMTTAVLALSSVEGRPAGTATKVDFSFQGWDGQLFQQMLFDATGIRSHQYSFYESEGDEQSTLAYPGDGVSGDALWFWARHMAAPALAAGERRTVMLLPALRDVRSQRHSLSWVRATLSHEKEPKVAGGKPADVYTVSTVSGTETFFVQTELPFRIVHWENSMGEHADWVTSNRLQSWDVEAVGPRKVAGKE